MTAIARGLHLIFRHASTYIHLDDADYEEVLESLVKKITAYVEKREHAFFFTYYRIGPDYYPIACACFKEKDDPNTYTVRFSFVDNDTVLAVHAYKTVFPALLGSLYFGADRNVRSTLRNYVIKETPPYKKRTEGGCDRVAASKSNMRMHDQIIKDAPPEISPYIALLLYTAQSTKSWIGNRVVLSCVVGYNYAPLEVHPIFFPRSGVTIALMQRSVTLL